MSPIVATVATNSFFIRSRSEHQQEFHPCRSDDLDHHERLRPPRVCPELERHPRCVSHFVPMEGAERGRVLTLGRFFKGKHLLHLCSDAGSRNQGGQSFRCQSLPKSARCSSGYRHQLHPAWIEQGRPHRRFCLLPGWTDDQRQHSEHFTDSEAASASGHRPRQAQGIERRSPQQMRAVFIYYFFVLQGVQRQPYGVINSSVYSFP